MKAGWQVRPLGELCEFRRGLTYAKGDEVENAGTPVLRAMNIDLATGLLDLGELRYIAANVDVPSTKMVQADTILICTASGSKKHLGKTAIIEEPMDFAFGGFMGLLVPTGEVLTRYLHLLMRSDAYWSFIDQLSSGTNINNLKFSELGKFKVPLPPLEEQHRIVALLDEVFEGLSRARANAEANLADAKELFDRTLLAIIVGNGGSLSSTQSEGWPEKDLASLVTFHNGDRGKNYPNKHEYVTVGIPWINTGHILPNGTLSLTDMNYISEEKFRTLSGGRIRPGDLVFCLRGATIGKTALVAPYNTGAVASSLMILRPSELILDRFAYYFLTSELGRAQIKAFIGGAAQPNLAGESVGKFRLRLPPKEVQKKIVESLDRLMHDRDILERKYQERMDEIDGLRQSLLQKALAGELT